MPEVTQGSPSPTTPSRTEDVRVEESYLAGCKVRVSRWVFLGVSLTQMLVLAGAVYGWPSMSVMLVNAGLFADGCPPRISNEPCASQVTTISLLFTVASICVFLAPLPTGALTDYAGPRRALMLMTALSALGFALLVIALRAGVPRLLFPAFGALGASTTMNLPLYGVANAFPSHEGMVMSLLNGAFDASCIVFVVFAAVVQATGADLSTVALGFLVGPVAALLLTSGLLWRDEPFMHPHVHGEDEGEGEGAVAAAAETPGGAAAAPLPLGDVALDVTEKAQAGGTLPQLARQPPASTGTPRAPPSPALPSSELPRRQDSSGGAATARSSGSSSPTPRRKPTLAAAFAVGSSRHIARGAARQLRGAASRQDKDGGAALAASGSLAALSEAGEEGGGAWSPSMSPRLDGTPVSPMMQGEAASPSVSPSPGGGGEAASPSVSPLPASGGGPVSPMMIAAAAAAAPDAGLSLAGDDALPAPTDAENAPPSSAVDVVVVVSASVSKSFPPHPHSSAVAATAAASDHPLLAPQHPEGGPRRASVPVASIDFSSVDGVDYGRLQSLPFIAQVRTPDFLAYVAFHVVSMLQMYFFLGSASAQLDALTGGAGVSLVQVLGITLPLGFFCQFAVGYVIDSLGLFAALSTMWVLGVVLAALRLVPAAAIQPLIFVIFVFYRAFIFSCLTNYMARHFGYGTLGKTMGTSLLLGGLGGLLQTPLLQWGFSAGGLGDFAPPNALILGLCTVAGALPLWFGLRTGRLRRLARRCAKSPSPPAAV